MFFFAAIGSTPHKPIAKSALQILAICSSLIPSENRLPLFEIKLSIPYRHADDVAALELTARSFRLVLFQTRKTRAIERLVAFDHRLSERVAALQEARCPCF